MEAVTLAERLGSVLKLILNNYYRMDELGSVSLGCHNI
jgi:hypothetical protein